MNRENPTPSRHRIQKLLPTLPKSSRCFSVLDIRERRATSPRELHANALQLTAPRRSVPASFSGIFPACRLPSCVPSSSFSCSLFPHSQNKKSTPRLSLSNLLLTETNGRKRHSKRCRSKKKSDK